MVTLQTTYTTFAVVIDSEEAVRTQAFYKTSDDTDSHRDSGLPSDRIKANESRDYRITEIVPPFGLFIHIGVKLLHFCQI